MSTATNPIVAAPAESPGTAVAPNPTAVDDSKLTEPSRASPTKKRETFLVPADLADKMRDAIVHLSGPPLYFTLAEFGEHAIRCYLEQLERDHNGGRAFPPRPRGVRQGRPLR